jgi:proteasome lid subunit RPN8/RPN11
VGLQRGLSSTRTYKEACVKSGFELTKHFLRDVLNHAEDEYPRECCGFIDESGVKRCNNVADDLHRTDPVKNPRDGRTAFVIGAAEVLFLQKSLDGLTPVRVLYHSHPDKDAYFSEEDQAFALMDGQPLYPLMYLVVSVRDGLACDAQLFDFDSALAAYQTIATFPQV